MTCQRSFYALAAARSSTQPRASMFANKEKEILNNRSQTGNDNGHYHRNCRLRARIIADSRNEMCVQLDAKRILKGEQTPCEL